MRNGDGGPSAAGCIGRTQHVRPVVAPASRRSVVACHEFASAHPSTGASGRQSATIRLEAAPRGSRPGLTTLLDSLPHFQFEALTDIAPDEKKIAQAVLDSPILKHQARRGAYVF